MLYYYRVFMRPFMTLALIPFKPTFPSAQHDIDPSRTDTQPRFYPHIFVSCSHRQTLVPPRTGTMKDGDKADPRDNEWRKASYSHVEDPYLSLYDGETRP